MPAAKDPTQALKEAAASLPDVVEGTSCSQTSYKAGKTAFLYVGPGAKGIGYKAMFKLKRSMPRARKLADTEPERFEVGSNGWVTTRFTAEKPLPRSIWEPWLAESYKLACPSKAAKR